MNWMPNERSHRIFFMELTLPAQFGRGVFTTCAYDTAWVARIASPTDNNRPAFEKSLQWLRINQHRDGSWGAEYPVYNYDRLVSTVSAIMALKRWNCGEDIHRIESGIEAINTYLGYVRGEYFRATFIFQFYPIFDEAIKGGIKFSPLIGDVIHDMRRRYREKSFIFKAFIKYKFILKTFYPGFYSAKSVWLFGLEGVGNNLKEETIRANVGKTGLIGHNYSATAFALIQNPKLISCLNALNVLVNNECTDGGIPGSAPEEIFSLSWSIGFLHMAGVDLKANEKIKPYIDDLESAWLKERGRLGGSVTMEADADDIANSLFALNSAGRLTDVKNTTVLLKLFRKNFFITWKLEKHPTLTTNIHCLLALKAYEESNNKVKNVVEKTKAWIKEHLPMEMYHDQFVDKWHISYIYPLSRAVCAFIGTDDEFALKCLTILMTNQNSDGGWGLRHKSSLEETAFAVLALNYWLKTGHNEQSDQIECILKTAKQYMNDPNNESIYPFWFAKTLYSPVDIVDTLIVSAKYALNKF